MADSPDPSVENRKSKIENHPFRWQSLFQHARQPIYVLNRQRRLVFVNAAWEEWAGRSAGEVRGLACPRHADAEPGSWEALAGALLPPAEVLGGRAGRVRRAVGGVGQDRRWCDIDFLPVQDGQGLRAVLGTITPISADTVPQYPAAHEELAALRAARVQRYRIEELAGSGPGASARLRQLVDQARLASQTRVPVLIRGEPGTGKEWLARAIHYQSAAREKAFVPVECAHLPAGTVASLLLGDGGLVWRSEVGALYLREPSRLPGDLRKRMAGIADASPAGGPRLLAGSSTSAGEAGPGDDLHCALGTLVLELPPLRDRPAADLPLLVERLLRRAAGTEAPPPLGLTPEAWEIVYTYPWPGNVRELYAVLAGALTRTGSPVEGRRIDAADLPLYLRMSGVRETAGDRPLPLDHLLEQAERRLITLALRRSGGNKTRAAELLSVWRPRLLRRMEVLGIADLETK